MSKYALIVRDLKCYSLHTFSCIPGRYMGTACAWPVARWARGTLRSSAALFWVPHLVPRKYGDPMCCPSAKRVDQVCRQPRHWYPACSRRDSGESAPYLRSDSSESEKQLEAALSSLLAEVFAASGSTIRVKE